MPTPWRNGQGVTRDIATVSGHDGGLLWQVSLAELTGDCDFSDYAGFDRVFTPVKGDLVALSHGDGPFVPCPLLTPYLFDGGKRTRCRLGGQAGRAFNVVTDPAWHRADVQVLRLAAGTRVPHGAVVHCCSGRLDTGEGSAGPGDSLLDGGASAAEPSIVILVRIGPA
ncbi:MAG TPA: HutD family protein [Acetobacteraceae bacterium]